MKVKVLRRLFQMAFFTLLTFAAVYHQIDKKGMPPVDALCPFGGLESIYSIVTQHQHLMRTNVISLKDVNQK